MAAGSVMRADCAFGAFYCRQRARLGPAHLIARIVYKMLKYKVEYKPLSVAQYEQHYREQQLSSYKRKRLNSVSNSLLLLLFLRTLCSPPACLTRLIFETLDTLLNIRYNTLDFFKICFIYVF